MSAGRSIYRFLYIVIMITVSSTQHCSLSTRTVEPVSSCPKTADETTQSANRKKCHALANVQNCTEPSKFKYHCLPDHEQSTLLEVCAPERIVLGTCVVYNTNMGELQNNDNTTCSSSTKACPLFFLSTSSHFYILCHEGIKGVLNNSRISEATSPLPDDTHKEELIIISTLPAFLIICMTVIAVFVWKRRQKFKVQKAHSPWNLRHKNMEIEDNTNFEEECKEFLPLHPGNIQGTINEKETNFNTKQIDAQYSVREVGVSSEPEKREHDIQKTESTLYEDILKTWREEDSHFIPTAACKFVEVKIRSQNFVTVVGNSGCGKTAIMQHIALKFKEEGEWYVKPVDDVREIKEICSTGINSDDKILFILNDPIGKETLDEISYNLWKMYEKTLTVCLKKVKLLVSCRRCVIYDRRVVGILKKKSSIVEIDSGNLKLTEVEKKKILNIYCQHMKLSEDDVREIVKREAYFPLLCKCLSYESSNKKKGINFFKYPFSFIKNDIEQFKYTDKKKYCAIILIIVFRNNLQINTIRTKSCSLQKYKNVLEICDLPEHTSLSVIRNTLCELEGSYVKRVGHVFHFLHDFIMEISTFVFGVDYPLETIQYAESGFMRRRMRIEDDTEGEDRDPFTIYLPEEYICDLVRRFIDDIQTENVTDVVINPNLRNQKVIKVFKESMNSTEVQKFSKNYIQTPRSNEMEQSYNASFSRIALLNSNDNLCPLDVLITFCHDEISLSCLSILKKCDIEIPSTFCSMCANGNPKFLDWLSLEYKEKSLSKTWGIFLPIHIASMFHNFLIIEKLIGLDGDVNKLTANNTGTPLTLAAGNNEEHLKEAGMDTYGGVRRNITILCLLQNGAKINFCIKNGSSPLWIACQNGHSSTAQLLLENGADINLCDKDGASPLWIACQNGHDSTAKLLLNNGADINLCNKDGGSPLRIACQNGHERTTQLLLKNGADINLRYKDGASPLWLACQNGHDSTAQLLLNNGADINLCYKDGTSSLFIACKNGHDSTAQLLLNNGADLNLCDNDGASPLFLACKNGHDSTAQLLLNNGANINLCDNDGASPLFLACKNGHDSTAQLLLNNGADLNLCDNDGASPLFLSCKNGHDSTAQLLLNNGADLNLCDKDGVTPLFLACKNGHDSTAQLLLNNGADLHLCDNDGVTPLFLACKNGHDSTAQLLLDNGADLNLCDNDGVTPLFLACKNGHDSTAQLLLGNGADINLCDKDGASPLFLACKNGHDSTAQLLLDNGADLNLCDNDGVSPLFLACKNGHDSTAQLLLNNGANINLCYKDGTSSLFIACKNGHDNTAQLLLYNGADINLCENNGASPLFLACKNGHDSTAQLLLNNGADLNLCDNDGVSPLFLACKNGHDSTAQLLLYNGADINLCDKDGASPLFLACKNGHDSTAQLLLDNGADINLCDKDGASPLWIVCKNGHRSTAKKLLNTGSEINLSDNDGASPLFLACKNGYYRTAQLLLDNGADINLCDKDGASPLQIACKNGHDRTAQLLLNNCTKIDFCDNDGVSSLLIARKNKHASIVELF